MREVQLRFEGQPFVYRISTRKGKKLMTEYKGKTIHFGASGYQHFTDATGLLPASMSHRDMKRQENYLKRSAGIKGADDPASANFHARRVLWAATQ